MFQKTFLLILIPFTILYGQEDSIKKYKALKENLVVDFIEKKTTLQQAIRNTENIHNRLKIFGKKEEAKEQKLYEGMLHFYNNDYPKAETAFEQGLEEIKSKRDTITFKYVNALAEINRTNFFFLDAEKYFHEGLTLIQEKPILVELIPGELTAFYSNYFLLLQRNGETEIDFEILQKAYDAAKTAKNKAFLSVVEYHLAQHYAGKEDFPSAEKFFIQAINNSHKPFYTAQREVELGELYVRQKKINAAKAVFKEAERNIQYIRSNSGDFELSKLKLEYWNASVAQIEGKNDVAIKTLENVVRKYAKLRNAYLVKSYFKLFVLTKSKKYLVQAFKECLVNKNGPIFKSDNILFAEEYVELGILPEWTEAELIRWAYTVTDLKSSFLFGNPKDAYQNKLERAIFLAFENNKNISPLAALILIEATKATRLFENIQKGTIFSKILSREEEAELQQKQSTVFSLQKMLVQGKSADISAAILELKKYENHLFKKYPALLEQRQKTNLVDITTLRKGIEKNEGMLGYLLNGKYIYAYFLNQKVVEFRRLIYSKELISIFLDKLYTYPGIEVWGGKEITQQLYKELIAPFYPFLEQCQSLKIIRDKELNLLPFEVLQKENGEFLIHSFAIRYDYSGNAFLNHQKIPKNSNLLCISPFGSKAFQNTGLRNLELGPLQYANEEVNGIGGTIIRNQNATKEKFKELYREFGIIHFATHAKIDENQISNSFVAFFPNNEEYKLTTEELYELNLRSTQLVVLSACETGRGEVIPGEGVISLARGFSYAGSPAVITTQWNAQDQTTAWIAEKIHDYLDKGWNKSKALQQAKLDFLRGELGTQYDHPYYWSNFILIGEDVPIQKDFWKQYYVSILLLLFLITLLLLWILRKNNVKLLPRSF